MREVENKTIDKYTLNSKVIAIIGVDGSGKSTCFNHLLNYADFKNIAAIGDAVIAKENYNTRKVRFWQSSVKSYLGPRVKNLKNRKLYRILKFFELLLRVKLVYKIDHKYAPDIILTDGSPIINILGWGHYY